MAFYRARLQMALIVHGGQTAVIETEIELPDFYQPQPGTWLYHPLLDGRTYIAACGYDAVEGRPVLTLGAGAKDASSNLQEWLEKHPNWRIAKKPTLDITKGAPTFKKSATDDEEGEDEARPPGEPPTPFSQN